MHLFLLSLASCEMFNIKADIEKPPDYSDPARIFEEDACVLGFLRQLKFNYGKTWKLLNWTGSISDGPGDNSLTCRGNLDLVQVAGGFRYMSEKQIRAWNKYIMQLLPSLEITCSLIPLEPILQPLCTGISACLTDECQCGGKPVFYCPGKFGGCIPFSQLCDGVANCEGGADECMCSGAVTVRCLPDKSYTACIQKKDVCSIEPILSIISCDNKTTSHCSDPREGGSTAVILQNTLDEDYYDILEAGFAQNGSVNESCIEIVGARLNVATNSTTNRWLFDLCGSLAIYYDSFPRLAFNCKNTADKFENIYEFYKICDGALDCSNGTDEMFCPDRFYVLQWD